MDLKNLVYNGDFELGLESWNRGTVTTASTGNYLTVSGGDLVNDVLIPTSSNRTYRLTFDLKINSSDGNYFYIALHPYDSSKNIIDISTTNLYNGTNANTTLAADLKSGDTTATLTSSSGWSESYVYQRIGICDIPAYGYNRCSVSYPYSSRSGNVLTLKSAYSGSTVPAGTKVSEFSDGGTYFYPWVLSPSEFPTDWTTYSVEFTGGNDMRYSTKYFKFATLGYGHNYSMRNIRIECISDFQLNPNYKKDFKVLKNGVASLYGGDESGMYIRYIRTSSSGNSVNTGKHLCEIQAFNSVGENIAWNKLVNGERGYRTDGSINVDQYASSTTHTLDLEFAEYIHKIKLWYYYGDGRTYYDKKVELSLDGTNWIEVYSGERPETSDGLEIILHPEKFKINKNGTIYSRELYEF